MRLRSRYLLTVALGVATSVALACAPTQTKQTAQEPWAATAEQWLTNLQEAGREGIPNVEAFLDPLVVLDHRGTGGRRTVGRDAGLALVRTLEFTQPGTRLTMPGYLAPHGLVVPASWHGRGLTEEAAMFEPRDAVLVMTLTSQGLVAVRTASSLVTGEGAVAPHRDWGTLLHLAQQYVDAHTSEEMRTTLDVVPGRGGPAVYGIPAHGRREGFREVVLLLRSSDDRGCPGRAAVSLRLGSDGRVVGEEKYLRVDDARRCLAEGETFDGWWTGMEVPDPVRHRRTGTVLADEAFVEVWNGSLSLEKLTEWALGRYRLAGLPVPRPASVTFFPAADRCLGNRAIAGGRQNSEIVLCFGEALACPGYPCPPWSQRAEAIVLHELAHTWTAQNLTAARREGYAREVGMAWADARVAWEERAIERAAEVISWGLQDRPLAPEEFSLSEHQLAREFRALTGQEPLSRR